AEAVRARAGGSAAAGARRAPARGGGADGGGWERDRGARSGRGGADRWFTEGEQRAVGGGGAAALVPRWAARADARGGAGEARDSGFAIVGGAARASGVRADGDHGGGRLRGARG